jgi:hypothetical protein
MSILKSKNREYRKLWKEFCAHKRNYWREISEESSSGKSSKNRWETKEIAREIRLEHRLAKRAEREARIALFSSVRTTEVVLMSFGPPHGKNTKQAGAWVLSAENLDQGRVPFARRPLTKYVARVNMTMDTYEVPGSPFRRLWNTVPSRQMTAKGETYLCPQE